MPCASAPSIRRAARRADISRRRTSRSSSWPPGSGWKKHSMPRMWPLARRTGAPMPAPQAHGGPAARAGGLAVVRGQAGLRRVGAEAHLNAQVGYQQAHQSRHRLVGQGHEGDGRFVFLRLDRVQLRSQGAGSVDALAQLRNHESICECHVRFPSVVLLAGPRGGHGNVGTARINWTKAGAGRRQARVFARGRPRRLPQTRG